MQAGSAIYFWQRYFSSSLLPARARLLCTARPYRPVGYALSIVGQDWHYRCCYYCSHWLPLLLSLLLPLLRLYCSY